MKISNETLTILQNFATINNGILVNAGSELKTISPNKTLMASALVKESFDTTFCIYDLSQFLGTLSLFDDPDLKFGDKEVTISEAATSIRYVYADPSTIVSPPATKLECNGDVEIVLDAAQMAKITKAASVLDLPNFVIASDEEFGILISARDAKNSSSNIFKMNMAKSEAVNVPDTPFTATMKFENLKLIAGDYEVAVSSKGIANFKTEHSGSAVEYYVAIEKNDSSF